MDIVSYLLGKNASDGGADLSEYFSNTIGAGTSNTNPGFKNIIINIPSTTLCETDLTYAFAGYLGETISMIDTSNVQIMSYLFSQAINLKTIPSFNTSKVTRMNYMFSGCTSLTDIPILNTSNLTSWGNMAYQTPLNGFVTDCTLLTDTSLDNILQMCINATKITRYKTLSQLGLTAVNYPASRIQALPHYQDFIDAGWTIGY